MTVADLIDYLNQFEPETRVVLSAADIGDEDVEFISLDILDYGE